MMMNVISSARPEHLWESSGQPMVFKFKKEHTKTAEYSCMLEESVFDFYVPLFMIPKLSDGSLPREIAVSINRSALKEEQELPIGIYKFDKNKVRTTRYKTFDETQDYNLYVPNEIFSGETPPQRLFVQITLP